MVSNLEKTYNYYDLPTGRKLSQDLLDIATVYSYDLIQYHVLLMKIREANLIQYNYLE